MPQVDRVSLGLPSTMRLGEIKRVAVARRDFRGADANDNH